MIKLKYFDKDWIKGNLSDREYEKREKEYDLYIKDLKKSMKTTERIFADINFNDAKIVSFKQSDKILFAEFYIGDLQNGYYCLKVKFVSTNSNLPSNGEILTSEIQKEDNKFYFLFVLTNLQEYTIEFSKIKELKFVEINEKYHNFKKFRR